MEKSNVVFKVPKCPLCGRTHTYDVLVLRSKVLFGTSPIDVPVEKRVRRLFTCPEKNEFFEGTVILQDDPVNKIASVKVEGLIKAEE